MIVTHSWMKAGALLAALAVVLGAFGTYEVGDYLVEKFDGQTCKMMGKEIPLAEKYMMDYELAVNFQLAHALAIVLSGLLLSLRPRFTIIVALWCFLIGTLLYCGGVYALIYTGASWCAAISPVGGILLVIGWFMFVEGSCQGSKKERMRVAAEQAAKD